MEERKIEEMLSEEQIAYLEEEKGVTTYRLKDWEGYLSDLIDNGVYSMDDIEAMEVEDVYELYLEWEEQMRW